MPRRVVAALALVAVSGCSAPDKAVVDTWREYHHAVRTARVETVRSLLAAGRGAELDDPGAATALELRSALVPEEPAVTAVEVSAGRATLTVEGTVHGQPMTGTVSLTRESGTWKVLEEAWSVELGGAVPRRQVDLAAIYSQGAQATPRVEVSVSAHQGTVTDLEFTPDGEYLASIGYDDRRLRLWNRLGELLDDIECDGRPSDLAMRPDGAAVYVVNANGRITEWPIVRGELGSPRPLDGLAGSTPRIAVDAAGHFAVTTSWTDPAKLWDLEAGAYVRTLPGSEKMRGVAFSPVGPMVACGSHTDWFAVWNLDRLSWPIGARKRHRVPKAGAQSDVYSIAYSSDGHLLATGHMDTSLSIWDMESGEQIHDWYVQDSSPTDVEFSPCGTVLATAQLDGQVFLWETESRRTLFRLNAHERGAASLAFDPVDGVTLATGGDDGAIRIWQ